MKGLSVVGLIAFILLFICIAPSLFLWAVNTLAEAGGSKFYIEHTLFNYFVSIIFLMLVRGHSTSSK